MCVSLVETKLNLSRSASRPEPFVQISRPQISHEAQSATLLEPKLNLSQSRSRLQPPLQINQLQMRHPAQGAPSLPEHLRCGQQLLNEFSRLAWVALSHRFYGSGMYRIDRLQQREHTRDLQRQRLESYLLRK